MRRGFTFLELLIIIAIVAILASILVPNFMKARARGAITACKSNCKNIATALEMYASDNHKHYPERLQHLTHGNYLKIIPSCPAAGRDTYSDSYATARLPVPLKGEAFRFWCAGNNHGKAYTGFNADSSNYPQYDSELGLLDHP